MLPAARRRQRTKFGYGPLWDRALTDPNLAAARDALMIQGFADLSLSDYHVCWR